MTENLRPADREVRHHRLPRFPLSDLVALLALAVLILLFFWKIALTNRVLAGLDVLGYFYPYRDLASAALRSGHLPLWNPYLFMGAPFLANSQAAVLYPLHWPLLWLSPPKQLAWSIVLHLWLASAGTYLLARWSLRLRPPAAFVSAAVLALGGFLGAQVEHLNQLNASAWLPWLLLCLEGAMGRTRWRWPALLAGGAIVGLALLAGHTQAAYIVLFGAGAYMLLRAVHELRARQGWRALRGLGALAGMVLIGLLLAAGQLLPSLELSRLSVRSGGLPYNEAASFSLKPGLVFKAFLPPLVWEPPFSEYVAYVGLIGLALAGLGAWAVVRWKQPGGEALGLALIGLFLAFGAYNPAYYVLYKVVPGFALFRAPARWLLLYSFGMALLAGIGCAALPRLLKALRRPPQPQPESEEPLRAASASQRLRPWSAALILVLLLELFVAGRRLAYNQPTAPAAYDSLRTAPSHLLADTAGPEHGLFRFLSLSDIGYDPGDMGDLQAMYSPELPEEAIYDLIVATKMKEVLAFNLPLRYRLFSVDGYDGGLLPIDRYVTLERLFLSQDEIWPDGRLRQQLRQVPPARLLSLLNVKYVMTDKTQDVWIDDVFYDLEHTVPLGEVALADLPAFETTQLGVVSYLTGTADLPDGTPVAQITITSTAGTVVSSTLHAGGETAEGLYTERAVAHRQARVVHHWRGKEQGNDYLAVLDLGQAFQPAAVSVRSLLPDERFHLRGLTLIDAQTGTSRNVSVDPDYRLAHSGDVKIYENMAVLPRAFVVHRATRVADDEEALALLADPGFDPAAQVILPGPNGGEEPAAEGSSFVEVVSYEPETIRLRASLEEPGYLVLTDANYPGWQAEVDGQEREILPADLYFRAVELPAGEHEVIFRFRPASVRLGLGVSLSAWCLWLLVMAVVLARIGRKSANSV